MRALMELPASAMRSLGAGVGDRFGAKGQAELWFPGVGFARGKAACSGPESPVLAVLSVCQPPTVCRAASVSLARSRCSVNVGVRNGWPGGTGQGTLPLGQTTGVTCLFRVLRLAPNSLQLLT